MKSPKFLYQTVPDVLRGSIKAALNTVLRSAGLEIGSTLKQHIEGARLYKLKSTGHWETQKYSAGLAIDEERILRFLYDTCRPYQSEYQTFVPHANGDNSQYFLSNGWFEWVDAEVLYGVVRRFQPANIVEVGSGFSTRLMRRAVTDGKLATRIISVDPLPNTSISPYSDEYIKSAVEDLDVGRIPSILLPGDILFIDSSHTVTTGGDVPYLFLEILPKLEPGVLIHIHDIFIPFDYPAEWVIDGWGWNEQYLVHAFLAYNESFEIVWPARYMWERHREAVVEIVPSAKGISKSPSSLWLRKVS